MRIAYRVIGRPVPQGSMVASYNRKMGVAHVHHVQGAALALWRSEVRNGAIQAGATLTVAPVAIYITFGMPRPKLQTRVRYGKVVVKPLYREALPDVAPDLDKLTRAVMDALTGVCYRDDAQVCILLVSKEYAEFTEIVVTDAWRPIFTAMAWEKDGERLGETADPNTSARQLRMSDMWETGSE